MHKCESFIETNLKIPYESLIQGLQTKRAAIYILQNQQGFLEHLVHEGNFEGKETELFLSRIENNLYDLLVRTNHIVILILFIILQGEL
jgi:hypothetical protein